MSFDNSLYFKETVITILLSTFEIIYEENFTKIIIA